MQYILTEKEYNDLVSKKEKAISLDEKKLLKLCVKIANEMPIKVSWKKAGEPWGCSVLDAEQDDDDYHDEQICDLCPVVSICPYEYKEFSK